MFIPNNIRKKTNGGGLNITDQNELDAIFNGLFDNIYLEYYGNVHGCLQVPVNPNDYTAFITEFNKQITNPSIGNVK